MLCSHVLSIILNLPIELLESDQYAFNSGNVTIHCVPALVQLFHLQLYYLTGFSPGHGRQTVWNGYNGKNLKKNMSDSSCMAMGLKFIGCREVPLKTSKYLERRSAHMFCTSDEVTICLLGLATCFGQQLERSPRPHNDWRERERERE